MKVPSDFQNIPFWALCQNTQLELVNLLERLNKAFKKGLNELEKEEAEILGQIDLIEKKTAMDKIEVYLNTASKYNAVLQYKKAISRYELARALQEKHIGTENERFASILNWLGTIHYTLAEYDKAIKYFKKALKIWLKVFGETHPQIAVDYHHIGGYWKVKGEYDKAIEYFEKALKIFKIFLPPNHTSIKDTEVHLKTAQEAR